MSMYNALFGQNPVSDLILITLGLKKDDFARFRDCFIEGDKIGVYTRLGGGNREGYEEVHEEIKKNPFYLYDEDDDFDCTYCTFYFSIPKEYEEDVKRLADGKQVLPSQKWAELIKQLLK